MVTAAFNAAAAATFASVTVNPVADGTHDKTTGKPVPVYPLTEARTMGPHGARVLTVALAQKLFATANDAVAPAARVDDTVTIVPAAALMVTPVVIDVICVTVLLVTTGWSVWTSLKYASPGMSGGTGVVWDIFLIGT